MVRGRSAWLVGLIAGALGAASACSLTVSTDGLTGGGADATGGSDTGGESGSETGSDATIGSDAVPLPDVQIIDAPTGACACLATPPGWIGPVAVWDGPGAPPTCGVDYPTTRLDAFADPTAPSATCGCTCGPATASGVCPTSFSVKIFSTNDCSGAACDTVTVGGACASVQANCNFAKSMLAQPPAPAASCVPQPTKTVLPVAWARSGRACEVAVPPTRGACGEGEACVPLPRAPMEPRPCVISPGDVACPVGGYAVRRVYYGAATDARDCTACTCGASPTACVGTITTQCNGPPGGIPIPTACARLNDPPSIQLTGALSFDAGACPPTSSTPTGAVTPTQPTTICCAP